MADNCRQVYRDMSDKTDILLLWYLGYQGDHETIQCMVAGSNGYKANQVSLNDGLNNHWARNNTPWSWGYLKREDIPVQFAIADAWTTGDMYQEGQITATNPNRVTLVSGTVNVPGSPQEPDEGGVYLDNNETPGRTPRPCTKAVVNVQAARCPTLVAIPSSGKPSTSSTKQRVSRGRCIKTRTTSTTTLWPGSSNSKMRPSRRRWHKRE